MGFLQGGCVAAACSRMREIVLDDLGSIRRCSRMRILVLETSGKALQGYEFAHSETAADNINETRRVRSTREATKMLLTSGFFKTSA